MATVNIFYTTKDNTTIGNLPNHQLVCKMLVENKDKKADSFILNELFKLFNWTNKDFRPEDPFVGFNCHPSVDHMNLSTGDIVQINRKFYIYDKSDWKEFNIDTDNEVPVMKSRVAREPRPAVKSSSITSNGGIKEGDIVVIVKVVVSKNGEEKEILQGRRAQVVGFSTRNPNKVNVILINDKNELQKCVVKAELENLIPEKDAVAV
ncbi:hypothetical protein D3C81_384610 [compost metagenome]